MTRLDISSAALFVNVTAKISSGLKRPFSIKCAILCVKTRVLPLPAPAKINTGLPTACTAFFCTLFKVLLAIYLRICFTYFLFFVSSFTHFFKFSFSLIMLLLCFCKCMIAVSPSDKKQIIIFQRKQCRQY